MKTKGYTRSYARHIRWMMMALTVLCFISCKEDKEAMTGAYDPDKPVIITDFSPKKGGLGTRMLLYGENFGNDISKVKVQIGGKDAKVINVKGESLYCVVPSKAYGDEVQVSILNHRNEEVASVKADAKFTYEKKLLVTSFLGTMYDGNTKYDQKAGPFNDCGGFGGVVWFSFDPQNHNHLYFVGEQHPTRQVDFEKEYVAIVSSGLEKARNISWTKEGDMVVTNQKDADKVYNTYLYTRASGFKERTGIVYGRNTTGAAIHPINGEMYYNITSSGQLFRYDFETKESESLFTIQDSGWEFNIQFEPNGNYAYIIVENKHYILRSDYDWENKCLTTPYILCGSPGSAGWVDAVGKTARLNTPRQGTFVKNEAYADGQYDFYFSDRENHCIRILTPEGKVTTFAGRGSNGTSGYNDGDLRQEARFNHPEGIVYDEERQCFFVGDRENRRIRKISYED